MKYKSNIIRTSFVIILLCIIVGLAIWSRNKSDKAIEKQEIKPVSIEHDSYVQQNETIDIPIIN